MTKSRSSSIIFKPYLPHEIDYSRKVELARTISELFTDAFSIRTDANVWTDERILEEMSQWTETLIILNTEAYPIGYCNIIFEQDTALGGSFLWIDSTGVRKAQQGQGVGKEILKYMLEKYESVQWLGGRTQNPSFIRLVQNFCDLVYPLQAYSQSDEGKELLGFMKGTFEECKNVTPEGVCRRAYRQGRLGDYPERKDQRDIRELFRRLIIDPDKGDALVVAGRQLR